MRSIALVCTLALIACSSGAPSQLSASNAEGKNQPPGQSTDPKGGRGGSGSSSGSTGGGSSSGTTGASSTGASSGAGNDALVTGGCTYTQGYWKNHASAWPVTSLTIGGVSYSEQQLLDIFGTPPKGDASIILAHQLITALLNTSNGATASASVQQAIDSAQMWMTANRGSHAGLPYGISAGSAAGQQATALTNTLDNFNSDHCGGGGTSGSSTSGSEGSGSSSGSSSACGAGGTPCTASGQCFEGMQCINGCCETPPSPPPPTAPTGMPIP